jgi:hypothetical protein
MLHSIFNILAFIKKDPFFEEEIKFCGSTKYIIYILFYNILFYIN